MRYFLFLILVCICNTFTYSKNTIVVNIQPSEDFSIKEVNNILPKLKSSLEDCTSENIEFKLLPFIKLKDIEKVNNSKYRAEDFISKANNKNITIVLTHKDICIKYCRGKKNWGILGLALAPKYKACVVSDHRLKNKSRDYWKVITHEFFHSYFKAKHCKNNDPSCIMQDANGHANFKNKFKVCQECKNRK